MGDFFSLDTQALEWGWPELEPGCPPPSARNAATMVALSHVGAGEGCPSEQGGGQGGSGATLVLHGGWRAFQETFGDTFAMDV